MADTIRQLAIEALSHMRENGASRLPVDEDARRLLDLWEKGSLSTSQQGCCAYFRPQSREKPSKRESQSEDRNEIATVEEKLAYLRTRAARWRAATQLGTLRSTMVFATGSPHAKLMLVGEAPGYEEERQQEPFVGPAGQKLNSILRAMGLRREEVYISNICKFRPSMGERQGTANRPPNEQEIAACLPLILAEIRAIRPVCIVCLGGSAAKGLLASASSVSSLRGKWLDCQGFPVRVTYHPSYLLRNEAISARRAVWEDMLAVMEKLEMPISKRQRQFFQSS